MLHFFINIAHTEDLYDRSEEKSTRLQDLQCTCWLTAAEVEKLTATMWRKYTLWELRKVKIIFCVWLIVCTVHWRLSNRLFLCFKKKEAWKGENSNGKSTQEATLKCSSANTHYFYTCTVKQEDNTLHYMRVTLQISGLKRERMSEFECLPSMALCSSLWSVSRMKGRYMEKVFKHDSGAGISLSYKTLLSEFLLLSHTALAGPASDLQYIHKCMNTWRRYRNIYI